MYPFTLGTRTPLPMYTPLAASLQLCLSFGDGYIPVLHVHVYIIYICWHVCTHICVTDNFGRVHEVRKGEWGLCSLTQQPNCGKLFACKGYVKFRFYLERKVVPKTFSPL